MTTKTAPQARPEAATRRSAAQIETKATRRPRVTSPARQLGGETTPANPLRGLFSERELALIDEQARAMGCSVVDIIAEGLRQWITPRHDDSDSHLDNGETPAPQSAPLDRFARLAILGEEVARITNQWGELEMVYGGHTHFYFVFEGTEILEGDEWMVPAQFTGEEEEYRTTLATTPPERMRKVLFIEPLPLDEIAAWLDQHHFTYPEDFRRSLYYFQKRQQAHNDDIARNAIAGERARIAQAMTHVLAA